MRPLRWKGLLGLACVVSQAGGAWSGVAAAQSIEEEPALPAAPPAAVPPPNVPPDGSNEARPAPKPRPERDRGRAMWIAGGSMLVGAYFYSAFFGLAFAQDRRSSPAFFIPLVGPLLFRYHDPGSETLFVVNAAAQIAGVALVVAGALLPRPRAAARLVVAPLASPSAVGLSLGGAF